MTKNKNLGVLLILVIALSISALNVSMVHSTESTIQDKSLTFISDVLLLDLDRYNVTLLNNAISFPDDLGGLSMENPRYILESKDSKLKVLLTFKNGTLSWCKTSILEGSPLYSETQSANFIERTNAFLENYQNYLGDSTIQYYKEMVSSVNEVKNITITTSNVKFELKSLEMKETSFSWMNTFNGAEYTKISFTFRSNGEFGMIDDRYNKIGSTDVKFSKEEVISIAMQQVKNISWTVENVEIGNVTVLDNRTSTTLLSAPKEPLVLYPYWQVSLTFDKIYAGTVYGVTYNIWADTGEIFYGHMQMIGGLISSEDLPETTTPSTQSSTIPDDTETNPSSDLSNQEPKESSSSSIPIDFGHVTIVAIVGIIISVAIYLIHKSKK